MVLRSRTPQGVRGLKPKLPDAFNTLEQSHSARSAWIETIYELEQLKEKVVALRKECVD